MKAMRVAIVGDDVKAQMGATVVHRVLSKLFVDRGVVLDATYQLNVGGNTDFLNMLDHSRLKSKRVSKTEAVQSQLDIPLAPDKIYIGPSDYISWLRDNNVCFLRMEGRGFGGGAPARGAPALRGGFPQQRRYGHRRCPLREAGPRARSRRAPLLGLGLHHETPPPPVFRRRGQAPPGAVHPGRNRLLTRLRVQPSQPEATPAK